MLLLVAASFSVGLSFAFAIVFFRRWKRTERRYNKLACVVRDYSDHGYFQDRANHTLHRMAEQCQRTFQTHKDYPLEYLDACKWFDVVYNRLSEFQDDLSLDLGSPVWADHLLLRKKEDSSYEFGREETIGC